MSADQPPGSGQPPPGYGQQPPPGYGQQPPPGYYGPPGWGPPRVEAPSPGPVPIRPMGLGEVLDGSFKLLRADFVPLLLAIVVVVVPTAAIAVALSLRFQQGLIDLASVTDFTAIGDVLGTLPIGSALGLVGVSVLQYLLLLAATAAVYRIAAARYLGRSESVGDALAGGFRRLLPLIGASLLIGLVALVAILVCVALATAAFVGAATVGNTAVTVVLVLVGLLPLLAAVAVGLGVYTATLLAAPAIVVEEAGVIASIQRSWRLVRPRFWPVLGTWLLALLVSNVIGFAFGGIPSFIGGLFPFSAWGQVLTQVGTALSTLVTTPIVALVTLMLYFDARIRQEGFDLEFRAADVGGGATGPGGGGGQGGGGQGVYGPGPGPGPGVFPG